MKRILIKLLLTLFFLISLAGCAGRQEFEKVTLPKGQLAAYLADKPEPLKPGFQTLLEEGKRNFVLNTLRVGTDALKLGLLDIARTRFDHALTYIEAVFADNDTAKKARSLWYEEGMKEFKGEPYERAMAYYYRGLIYLWDKDFENARACFKGGVLQDAFAEEQQNRCDFALLIFLEGYASRLLEDRQMAAAANREVRKLRPDYIPPPKNANLLLIVETGASPRKLADGIGHDQLKFFRGRDIVVKQVTLRLKRGSVPAYPMEDIAWQAMTRGGRPVDKIVAGQVEFRKKHEKISTTLTDVSSAMLVASPLLSSASSTFNSVGAGLGLLGVAGMSMAARTRTHADTRYWDNLPDTVHLAGLRLNSGTWRITFEYRNAAGKKVAEETEKIRITHPKSPHLLWKRQGSPLIFSGLK